MTLNVSNVLSPKSLDKQLKIYESRIQVLQLEMDELLRLKGACQLLLGTTPLGSEATEKAQSEVLEATPKSNGSKKTKAPALPHRIFELLQEKERGLTAEEIFSELLSRGVPLPVKEADASIESTLNKYPDLFIQENNVWRGISQDQ